MYNMYANISAQNTKECKKLINSKSEGKVISKALEWKK